MATAPSTKSGHQRSPIMSGGRASMGATTTRLMPPAAVKVNTTNTTKKRPSSASATFTTVTTPPPPPTTFSTTNPKTSPSTTTTTTHHISYTATITKPPSPRLPLSDRDRNQHAARPMTAYTPSRPASCISSKQFSASVPPPSSSRSPNSTASTINKQPSVPAIKMPPGDGGGRPRQPQLAPKIRPPLTPKVATSKTSSYQGGANYTHSSQPVTPLGRRGQIHAPVVATLAGAKDDGAPTLAPYLSTNVTPRSGSRHARVESPNTTPNGTPVPPDRSGSNEWADKGLNGFDSGRSSTHSSAVGEPVESKFFYASDARAAQPSQPTQQRPPVVASKSPPTFFYANGAASSPVANKTINPTSNPIYSSAAAAASEPTVSKFFYANGQPNNATRGTLTPSVVGSAVSSASRAPKVRPTTSASVATPPIPPITSRPASPIKATSQPITQTMRTSRATSPTLQPTTPTVAPTLAAAPPRQVAFRRDSIESSTHRSTRAHSRADSIPTMETVLASPPATTTQLTASPTSAGPSSPLPSPGLLQPTLSMASLMQATEAFSEEEDEPGAASPSGMASPTKSSNDPVSELVQTARRERKVQDLEITNASLEAINRTLERQLRKQTAELRRYKRMSRSRLSMTSGASSRVTSGTSTIQGLADLSEEEEDSADDDEEDSFSDEDDDDLSGSDAGSQGQNGSVSADQRIFARRKREEKRLQLDLTKHQELLVDSQKINQSLKRCLDWTEDLIKEGRKALDYTVRVSEVELGGRVLAPVDDDEEEGDEDDEEGGDGIDSPAFDNEDFDGELVEDPGAVEGTEDTQETLTNGDETPAEKTSVEQ